MRDVLVACIAGLFSVLGVLGTQWLLDRLTHSSED
jgi:hypothetical protein